MITIIKKIDNVYGGYDYVEYNADKQIYKTGSTRSHRGHYPTAESMEITVSTQKELSKVETQLEYMGYKLDKDWN